MLKTTAGNKHGLGEWYDTDGWVGLTDSLGDRIEVRDGDLICVCVYVESDVIANLITDIYRWDTLLDRHVDVTTDASNAIAGLHTGAVIQTATGHRGWLVCGGVKLGSTNFGGTAIWNNILGDGAVVSGEGLMPHASTDGMVDTDAGAAVQAIGVSGEDDAPALTIWSLFCMHSMV